MYEKGECATLCAHSPFKRYEVILLFYSVAHILSTEAAALLEALHHFFLGFLISFKLLF